MLFLFYITSIFILFSTVGFGFLMQKFLKLNFVENNIGIQGIFGLFTLSLVTSYSHLVVAHNFYHNVAVIFVGLVSFLFFFEKKKLKNLLIIFTILFIAIILSKNNEDFGYYHLPNTIQFSEQKIQLGLGNLNHGFKHISMLFMLQSLTYLPIFEYYLINLINFLFYVFLITFLYEVIKKNRNVTNFTKIILSLFLTLFISKFSRLSEFGSDIAGQILIVVSLFFIFELIYNIKLTIKDKISYVKLFILLIIFSTSLKFISIIYSLFLFAAFYFIKSTDKKKIISSIFNYNYFSICFLSFFIFIILNITATGCVVYPVEKLCFYNKFDWSLGKNTIQYLNFHYELWAKGGLGPNISVENEESYISFLNWLPHWIDVYFFTKFSDYILVSLLIALIFSLFYFNNKTSNLNILTKNKRKDLFIFLTSLLIFLVWFFNFPTLRYAGYVIVFLIIILPFAIFLRSKIDFDNKKNLKKLKIIFFISYLIFFTKNVSRLNEELNIPPDNHHNFKNFPFYWIKDIQYEIIFIDDQKLYKVNDACWNVPSTCVRNTHNLRIKKKGNYNFYINEKK